LVPGQFEGDLQIEGMTDDGVGAVLIVVVLVVEGVVQ
jgi:hypothetical protein